MSADRPRPFRLVNADVRMRAAAAIWQVPEGWVADIKPPRRSLDQNARLHAMLSDIAASGFEWAGCRRTVDELKVLFVSAHAIAEGRNQEVVRGLEDEPVALRESTASMSKDRLGSLMEYIAAWCAQQTPPIRLRDGREG